VGLRSVLEAVVEKIPSPRQESNPRTSIVQPVAQRYTEREYLFSDVTTIEAGGVSCCTITETDRRESESIIGDCIV